MSDSILKPFVLTMTLIIVAPISAQEIHSYKLVPKTVLEKKPVKVIRWVDETVMEKQKVTSYKKVWQTETRERRKTEYKPVRKTSQREERTVVRKPIVETRYRKRETRKTTYETVTEMRDEQYTVRKPIIETEMREERVTVRKPVTENLIEVQRTTNFRPVITNKTVYVPQDNGLQQLSTVSDPNRRPRLQWLPAGYHTDPVTGQAIYRRGGFYWVPQATTVASTVPTLVPQEIAETSYVPETTETRKPVQVTRFVEQTELRKVPVEVHRTVESVETRKVPVTIQVPKTSIVVEDIPYTETVYRDEVTVKMVPFTETTYEKVETVEPYTVEVPRWIQETSEVEVPRVVRKRVETEVLQDIPRTVMYRVPLDICGNEIGPPEPVYQESVSSSLPATEFSSASGTTTTRRVDPNTNDATNRVLRSVLADGGDSNEEGYTGDLNLVRPKTLRETAGRESSIEVPETDPEASKTKLGRIPAATNNGADPESEVDPPTMPDVEPSDSGDETAADRPPVPREPNGTRPTDDAPADDRSSQPDDEGQGGAETDGSRALVA